MLRKHNHVCTQMASKLLNLGQIEYEVSVVDSQIVLLFILFCSTVSRKQEARHHICGG